MPFISFIIPLYNVADTLHRAVNSIDSQLRSSNYEIILIDDGSTDSTKDMAIALANKDPRIKFYTAGNGVSHARNVGIKHSTGDFIAFLDADDYYLPKQLPLAIDKLNETKADLQIFSFEHGERPVTLSSETTKVEDIRCTMLENPTKFLTVWSKFFKRSLLVEHELYFNEQLSMSEDSDFLIRFTKYCSKISISKLPLYHYSIDTPSATRSFDAKKAQNYLTALEATKDNLASETDNIQRSFLIYTLIQVNILAVRGIFTHTNPASAREKRHELSLILNAPVINYALRKIPFKSCLKPKLLPAFFLKLHCTSLAVLLFKLRSFQNSQREKK